MYLISCDHTSCATVSSQGSFCCDLPSQHICRREAWKQQSWNADMCLEEQPYRKRLFQVRVQVYHQDHVYLNPLQTGQNQFIKHSVIINNLKFRNDILRSLSISSPDCRLTLKINSILTVNQCSLHDFGYLFQGSTFPGPLICSVYCVHTSTRTWSSRWWLYGCDWCEIV